ncbi:MAG: C40 family peptidase [Rickettsiales bacterium]|nr:C40 family peptidase [Rickettsiales bacterium]
MTIAEDIVVRARTWLGTPFHHQARLKGKGCDCLGLIIGVVDELGLKDAHGRLLSAYDEITYPKEPDGAYLIEKLTGLLDEVPIADARAGDLALFKVRENPQHLAILSDYDNTLGMIHSFAPSRRVVEHRLDDDWKSRLLKVYRWQP